LDLYSRCAFFKACVTSSVPVTNDRNFGTGRYFRSCAEFKEWQSSFVYFENREVSRYRLSINEDLCRFGRPIRKLDDDSMKALASVLVEDNMGSSQNPAVLRNDEARCSSICNVDTNDPTHESIARFDLTKRLLGGLAINCGASEEESKDSTEPHRATPAREMH
jgi:hypothetical protein